jgi:hypothetical protein
MNVLNKILKSIYYTIGVVWFIAGVLFFFFRLDSYNQTSIVAIYGVILTALIMYLGLLHSKACLVRSVLFPIVSLFNLALGVLIVYTYFSSTDRGGLGIFYAVLYLCLTTLASLCLGTFKVREVWRQSVPMTIILVTLVIIWTYVFTSF